jgi:cobalt/nickel transport system permease protein
MTTMADGHVHGLYLHGHSPLHRVSPQVKIIAALLLVLGFVATPRTAVWAFGIYAVVVVGMAAVARIPPRFALRRMVIEVPFLLVVLLLPILGSEPDVTVLGISLSEAGLWDAWNILAKATLGLGIAVVLGATTQVPDILVGLDGLKMPSIVTSIAGFMVRYIDVIATDWRRMRVAMASRGHEARWFGQIGPIATTLGAMFVRTFERGERIYLAMRSRGYTGTMPTSAVPATPPAEWVAAIALAAAVWTVAATAMVLT